MTELLFESLQEKKDKLIQIIKKRDNFKQSYANRTSNRLLISQS